MTKSTRVLPLAAILSALAMAVAAQDLGANIAVQAFMPEDSLEAKIATELIRTDMANSSLVHVIDIAAPSSAQETATSVTPDFSLSGNVSTNDGTITISIKLVETSTSKIIKSERESCTEIDFYAKTKMLAADLANSIVAAYMGSTLKSIRALIGVHRYDEADRRLDAFASREGADPAIPGLRREIALGQAKGWLLQARGEYAAALAAKEEGNALALQAKSSVEAALGILPDHPGAQGLRSDCVDFLRDSVLPHLKKLEAKRKSELYSTVKADLRAGNSQSALETLDLYFELNGESEKDASYKDLRAQAARGIARGIALQAIEAQKMGHIEAALSLATSALSKAPEDDRVRSIYKSVAERQRKADDAERGRLLLGDDAANFAARAGWEIFAEGGFRTFGDGNIDLPLAGALPAITLGVTNSLLSTDRFRVFDYARLSLAGSANAVQTQGYSGQLQDSCYAFELGAGAARIKSNWATGLRLGLSAEYWDYTAIYDYQGEQRIAAALFGLGVAAAVQADVYLSRHVSFGGSVGFEGLWFPTYGLSSNLQLAVRTSYSF